jgi:hypothetical protein
MSQHLTEAQLLAYSRSGKSITEEIRAQRDHIVTCEQCLKALKNTPEFQELNQLLAWDLFQPHLPYEINIALIEGTLSEAHQRNAERHMNICAWCQAEVENLRSIYDEMQELNKKTVIVNQTVQGTISTGLVPNGQQAKNTLPAEVKNLTSGKRRSFFPTIPVYIGIGGLAAAATLIVFAIGRLNPEFHGHSDTPPGTMVLKASDGTFTMMAQGSRTWITQPQLLPRELQEAVLPGSKWPQPVPASSGKPGPVAGPQDAPRFIRVRQPVGTVVIERPSFAWDRPDGIDVTGYSVKYWAVDLNTQEDLGKGETLSNLNPNITSIVLPHSLPPGGYRWQVHAEGKRRDARSRPVSLETSFLVLPAQCRSSEIALGIANARMGQFPEATAHFQRFRDAQARNAFGVRLADEWLLKTKQLQASAKKDGAE